MFATQLALHEAVFLCEMATKGIQSSIIDSDVHFYWIQQHSAAKTDAA